MASSGGGVFTGRGYTEHAARYTSSMSNIFAQVAQHWLDGGVRLHSPATDAQVAEFEHSQGIKLPGDVREYLLSVGGMMDGEMCSEGLTFYGLSGIYLVDSRWKFESNPLGLSVIGDYLANCFCYAFSSTGNGNGEVYEIHNNGNDPGQPVAASFRELMKRYLANPHQLSCGLR